MTVLSLVDVELIDLDEKIADLSLLSVAERERAARYRFEWDRRRFIAGRVALRRRLGGVLDCPPDRVELMVGPFGKPQLPNGLPQFNVSHSGQWALIAVTEVGTIGVDIEAVDQRVDIAGVGRRTFSTMERSSLAEVGDRVEGFFDLWTLKEAVVKADGRGLSLEPATFTVSTGEEPRLLDPPDGSDPSCWQLRRLEVPEGLRAALALRTL